MADHFHTPNSMPSARAEAAWAAAARAAVAIAAARVAAARAARSSNGSAGGSEVSNGEGGIGEHGIGEGCGGARKQSSLRKHIAHRYPCPHQRVRLCAGAGWVRISKSGQS